MKKVLVVFGTRPEAIKMAPLVRELRALPDEFDLTVCVTAQHREMLDQVLRIFDITPEIDLDIMQEGQTLSGLTSSIVDKMDSVLKQVKPDVVLVHGDTTTTFGTALACYYSNVIVGHVEAGLRTFDVRSPFPEEFNRQVVSRISEFHFSPTEVCRKNLINEGVSPEKIFVTGNTVIDALMLTLSILGNNEETSKFIDQSLNDEFNFDWKNEKFVLITGHRRENFGPGFVNLCEAIRELSELYPKLHFVYPVHLNPNVQKPVIEILGGLKNVHLIAPLNYLNFVTLLKECYLVLTDSGGLQEEAPSLGKPVILMRNTTERPEGIQAGIVRMVGTDKEKIVAEVGRLLSDSSAYEAMANASSPFGDGKAAGKIIEALRSI